jgi:hypothetical protein
MFIVWDRLFGSFLDEVGRRPTSTQFAQLLARTNILTVRGRMSIASCLDAILQGQHREECAQLSILGTCLKCLVCLQEDSLSELRKANEAAGSDGDRVQEEVMLFGTMRR